MLWSAYCFASGKVGKFYNITAGSIGPISRISSFFVHDVLFALGLLLYSYFYVFTCDQAYDYYVAVISNDIR